MKCCCCKKDLPESEFYNSTLKRGWHICKKCHNKKAYPQIKKYAESLKHLDERDFDRYYGGIRINITNYPREYQIINTSGESFLIKDKDEFVKKLLDILK